MDRSRLDEVADHGANPKSHEPQPHRAERLAWDFRRGHACRKNEKQWPDDADNNPGRFIMNDAVRRKDPNAVNCKETDGVIAEELAGETEEQTNKDWPFIAYDQLEPVRPRLFVAVTGCASLIPDREGLVEPFHSW